MGGESVAEAGYSETPEKGVARETVEKRLEEQTAMEKLAVERESVAIGVRR